jgi:hypothetical protein
VYGKKLLRRVRDNLYASLSIVRVIKSRRIDRRGLEYIPRKKKCMQNFGSETTWRTFIRKKHKYNKETQKLY